MEFFDLRFWTMKVNPAIVLTFLDKKINLNLIQI